MSRLVAASVFTLTALFGLFLGFIVFLGYLTGSLAFLPAILLTVIIELVVFLISPFIMDLNLRWFFKAKKYDAGAFQSVDPHVAGTVRSIAERYGFRPPTIYLIPDDHPTAFCYGIGRSGARVAISRGILTYLDPEERAAVVAHEMGHIVHRDFIVMTLAAIVVQTLYIIADALLHSRSSSRNRRGGGLAVLIGIVAYVLYWIANLTLLWLSRIREYYADEFAAKETSPRALASALVKVAYGIMTAPGEARLVKRVGALAIMDTKTARQGLLLNRYIESHPEVFEKMLAYDLYSPWAKLAEITSTHPLPGKRIARLLRMDDPTFSVRKPDMERVYARFLADLAVWAAPIVLPPVGIFLGLSGGPAAATGGFLSGLGAAVLLRTFYAYPPGEPEEATILDLMCDPYASPLRGKPIRIRGKIVGRGIPGYQLSEDFAVDDGTGLIYVDFRALVPLFGEIFFALSKVKKIMGQEGTFRGWFLRRIAGVMVLAEGQVGDNIIHSHPRAPGIAAGIVLLFLGTLLLL